MFTVTRWVLAIVTLLVLSGSLALDSTSPFWQLVALPLLLCGIGLIAAWCEYLEATLEMNRCEVLHLKKNNTPRSASMDKAA